MPTRPTHLYRGDSRKGVALPDPAAPTKIVAHILYLGGAGRPTPFISTSASRSAAEHFAGRDGRVWQTDEDLASSLGALHISAAELQSNLTGNGKGQCRWDDPFEVAQARAYVKQWQEHLLNWSQVDTSEIAKRVHNSFT
ncbi:MAG: hypothetical protein IPK80_27960 [Nannocystis sp.]|nr:hypothetical protein [Nannocystis sp.]